MAKVGSLEIMFKALIREFAHDNGIAWEKIHDTPMGDYLTYLQREYPTDERLFTTLPRRELLEKWWDKEVGNTDWLEQYAKLHP